MQPLKVWGHGRQVLPVGRLAEQEICSESLLLLAGRPPNEQSESCQVGLQEGWQVGCSGTCCEGLLGRSRHTLSTLTLAGLPLVQGFVFVQEG